MHDSTVFAGEKFSSSTEARANSPSFRHLICVRHLNNHACHNIDFRKVKKFIPNSPSIMMRLVNLSTAFGAREMELINKVFFLLASKLLHNLSNLIKEKSTIWKGWNHRQLKLIKAVELINKFSRSFSLSPLFNINSACSVIEPNEKYQKNSRKTTEIMNKQHINTVLINLNRIK
jgi:hypothetical protein